VAKMATTVTHTINENKISVGTSPCQLQNLSYSGIIYYYYDTGDDDNKHIVRVAKGESIWLPVAATDVFVWSGDGTERQVTVSQ